MGGGQYGEEEEMIDINFYQKFFGLKQRLMKGEKFGKEVLWNLVEYYRELSPTIYNIETTNACNMKCKMCPRTTMMTRKIEIMGLKDFENIVSQIRPWDKKEWEQWQTFVEKNYKVDRNEISQNNFFLFDIPRVVVLHGYGDPLLDETISQKVYTLSKKNIPSYFSCNPANINLEKSLETFKNGLGIVKYSIESVEDNIHKQIRGEASNFSNSYKKIVELINKKEKQNLETKIVITMLDLGRPHQEEEFEKLKEKFKGYDVYIYKKSQDQVWYQNKEKNTSSIHWLEPCQFPWSSMTIKSNSEAVQCVEDYNNEIVLGNAKKESLYHIWNGKKYDRLRRAHFDVKPGIKCSERCDMKLLGEYL